MSTLIIAEAGVNHNGDIKKALELVRVAADAGADMVKFQTFNTDKSMIKTAQKADYQKRTTSNLETQYEMVKKLELSKEMHERIAEECEIYGIKFFSTAFDIESVDLLMQLGMKIFKIASGEITNLPLIRYIGSQKLPIILSTGMCYLEEIEDCIKVLEKSGAERQKITVLHCNTEYPTPLKDVNLRAMLNIKSNLNVKVGYSDHTLGIEIPVAAVALGATVIEKHFTLNRNLHGPDHKASLEPDELKLMIKSIRNVEKALGGDGFKTPSSSEKKNINIARKSLVAIKPIKSGEVFTEKNIGVKRPGNGVSPMKWDRFIGNKSKFDYEIDDLLKQDF